MVIDVRWGSATHQGRVRDHNEDAVLAGPHVFAVADGMGGHAGGAVASGIAVAGLAHLCDLDLATDPVGWLIEELEHINSEIRRRAAADGALTGMGTTVAGIAPIAGRRLLVFNLGDSRVYRLRRGQLRQLTHDHSLVADLVRAGELSEEEAAEHPQRNVVTRALGAVSTVEAEVDVIDAEVGDCFLVASDGLSTELPRDQIGDLLATPGTVDQRARALLEAALFRGARDNVSVVVVAVAGTMSDHGLDADTTPSRPSRQTSDLDDTTIDLRQRPPVGGRGPTSTLAPAPSPDTSATGPP